MRLVSPEDARRIAIRAQLLDGSAKDVLDAVRRLGFLQIDPIATVAPAQHLVLWSRLGNYDTAELDRLLWEERSLFEFNAYVYPIETLPLIQARMRRWRRSSHYMRERWVRGFLSEHKTFRRYVMREIEQRGPLLSRELEDRAAGEWRKHRWYGARRVGLMLTALHLYGELAVAGRRNGQRLWDLAERWYPTTETVSIEQAERKLSDQRFRSQGVRLGRKGWEAHDDAADDRVPDSAVVLSPFDRLVSDRKRAEALFGFVYRLEMFVPAARRQYGYYVLPILHRDRLVGRIEPVFDRKARVLEIKGVWMESGAPDDAGESVAASLRNLADWLGAGEIRGLRP